RLLLPHPLPLRPTGPLCGRPARAAAGGRPSQRGRPAPGGLPLRRGPGPDRGRYRYALIHLSGTRPAPTPRRAVDPGRRPLWRGQRESATVPADLGRESGRPASSQGHPELAERSPAASFAVRDELSALGARDLPVTPIHGAFAERMCAPSAEPSWRARRSPVLVGSESIEGGGVWRVGQNRKDQLCGLTGRDRAGVDL